MPVPNTSLMNMGSMNMMNMDRIVYIKEVQASDLPKQLAETIAPDGTQLLYAICSADGTPMSIVKDRATAFTGARHYDLEPQSVH